MYSDYENENQGGYQNEEDDSRNNKSSGGISSFLPSAKVLGIIVVIEVLVFLGIFLFKKNEDSNITIAFENNPEYVSINNSKKINFKVNDSVYNGDYNDVNFNIDDTTLAAINNGVVTTGNKLGSTNITVLYNTNGKSYSATGRLIVHKGELNTNVSEISVPQGTLILKPSSTFDLANSLTITPQNGYIEKIEYTNANGSILKIDESGLVEGLAVGEDEVTITVNNSVSTRFKVTVVDAQSPLTVGFQDITNVPKGGNDVQSITFTQPEITKDATGKYQLTLTVNSNYTLTPTVNPITATDKKLTFDVLDKTILSLTPSADGTSVAITALKAGTTTITVKSSNNVTETLTVIVNGGSSSGGHSSSSGGGSSSSGGGGSSSGGGGSSSGGTGINPCYCNSAVTACNWGEPKNDMNIKHGKIPNSNACSIYPIAGGLCFKKDGKYEFGKFGDNSDYTYVAGAHSKELCDADKIESERGSLTCPSSTIVGDEGSCVYSGTSGSMNISSVSVTSGSDIVSNVRTSGVKVLFKCEKTGSATIKVKSTGKATATQEVNCVDDVEFSCPTQVSVDGYAEISSNSAITECTSSNTDYVKVSSSDGNRCVIKGIELGKKANVTVKTKHGDKTCNNIEVVEASKDSDDKTSSSTRTAKDFKCENITMKNGSWTTITEEGMVACRTSYSHCFTASISGNTCVIHANRTGNVGYVNSDRDNKKDQCYDTLTLYDGDGNSVSCNLTVVEKSAAPKDAVGEDDKPSIEGLVSCPNGELTNGGNVTIPKGVDKCTSSVQNCAHVSYSNGSCTIYAEMKGSRADLDSCNVSIHVTYGNGKLLSCPITVKKKGISAATPTPTSAKYSFCCKNNGIYSWITGSTSNSCPVGTKTNDSTQTACLAHNATSTPTPTSDIAFCIDRCIKIGGIEIDCNIQCRIPSATPTPTPKPCSQYSAANCPPTCYNAGSYCTNPTPTPTATSKKASLTCNTYTYNGAQKTIASCTNCHILECKASSGTCTKGVSTASAVGLKDEDVTYSITAQANTGYTFETSNKCTAKISKKQAESEKKAKLTCKTNLMYDGKTQTIASCENCTIKSCVGTGCTGVGSKNASAKGVEKSNTSYTVTATPDAGYTFEASNSCTAEIKKSLTLTDNYTMVPLF